ncbi:MAG TPA: hypothetical protein VMV71_02070 [Candidatus Paceibacterota bacterium]|nr:hypothetical protein [Candidatus Paceibacterota bacterium]
MNSEKHSPKIGNAISAASGFTSYARSRAIAAAIFLGTAGIISLGSIIDWSRSWPLILFYATLLTNTYFSIRSFASITPENTTQKLIDVALVVFMFLMVFNFNSVLNFAMLATLLFIIATLKYIFLIKLAGYSKLLYMKIRIDTLGILFCFMAVIGTLWGYGRQTSIIWAIAFALANVYVLRLEPHYRLENHYESR